MRAVYWRRFIAFGDARNRAIRWRYLVKYPSIMTHLECISRAMAGK